MKNDIENEKPNLKCQVGTMGFSNASLEYLNYPTQVESKLLQHVCHDKQILRVEKLFYQVIFKCCKLIPVLLGGILIQVIRVC